MKVSSIQQLKRERGVQDAGDRSVLLKTFQRKNSLCRQFGKQLVALYRFHNMSARQNLRRQTFDAVWKFIQVAAVCVSVIPVVFTERNEMTIERGSTLMRCPGQTSSHVES